MLQVFIEFWFWEYFEIEMIKVKFDMYVHIAPNKLISL
jgi:hypothetical protein